MKQIPTLSNTLKIEIARYLKFTASDMRSSQFTRVPVYALIASERPVNCLGDSSSSNEPFIDQ